MPEILKYTHGTPPNDIKKKKTKQTVTRRYVGNKKIEKKKKNYIYVVLRSVR